MLGGGLFSRYFLDTGIQTTAEWADLQRVGTTSFADAARARIDEFHAASDPNEAVTEERLIFPILRLLGWDLLPQQGTERREDIPDALLFADPASARKAMATNRRPDRFRHATIVHESKRWDLKLDRASDASGRTPASQALRYLRLAEELSHGQVRWALLTNGRLWRLYFQGVGSRAEQFLEADLSALLEPGGETALAIFVLLFRRDSFVAGTDGRTFFQTALDLAQAWREQVTADLAGAVFDDVFPALLDALSEADPEPHPTDASWPNAVRDAALILLYRLLFLLYAEDRDLLPVTHDGYRPFAITTMRHQVAEAIAHAREPSATETTFWRRLIGLFHAVAGGNDAMGMPPYNGGLFESQRAPLLARVALPDAAFARVLDRLSVIRKSGDEPRWINYRDLSVQQLGAIYEGLLERRVEVRGSRVAPVHVPTSLARAVVRQLLLVQERFQLDADGLFAIIGIDRRCVAERQIRAPATCPGGSHQRTRPGEGELKALFGEQPLAEHEGDGMRFVVEHHIGRGRHAEADEVAGNVAQRGPIERVRALRAMDRQSKQRFARRLPRQALIERRERGSRQRTGETGTAIIHGLPARVERDQAGLVACGCIGATEVCEIGLAGTAHPGSAPRVRGRHRRDVPRNPGRIEGAYAR